MAIQSRKMSFWEQNRLGKILEHASEKGVIKRFFTSHPKAQLWKLTLLEGKVHLKYIKDAS